MKQITKEQLAQISKMTDECEKRAAELNQAIDLFNDGLNKARADIEGKLDLYSASAEKLRAFYGDLGSVAQDYYDERNEKWQESEEGVEYAEWIERLTEIIEIEEIDIDFPEGIEEPDLPDYADTSWLPPEAPGE